MDYWVEAREGEAQGEAGGHRGVVVGDCEVYGAAVGRDYDHARGDREVAEAVRVLGEACAVLLFVDGDG